jgi:DNA-binding HxlR family transcriptional regulator
MTRITKRLPGLPIERALGVISGRWKAVIVYVLLDGPKRACDLENRISGISQKVLIQQLRSLEEHGLVYRQTFTEEAKRVDYGLSPLGMSLRPLIFQLYEWGLHHAEEREETGRLLPCEAVVRDPPEKGALQVTSGTGEVANEPESDGPVAASAVKAAITRD